MKRRRGREGRRERGWPYRLDIGFLQRGHLGALVEASTVHMHALQNSTDGRRKEPVLVVLPTRGPRQHLQKGWPHGVLYGSSRSSRLCREEEGGGGRGRGSCTGEPGGYGLVTKLGTPGSFGSS